MWGWSLPGLGWWLCFFRFEMWGWSLAGLGWWPCFPFEMWGWSLAGVGWWPCFHFEMWGWLAWAGGSVFILKCGAGPCAGGSAFSFKCGGGFSISSNLVLEFVKSGVRFFVKNCALAGARFRKTRWSGSCSFSANSPQSGQSGDTCSISQKLCSGWRSISSKFCALALEFVKSGARFRQIFRCGENENHNGTCIPRPPLRTISYHLQGARTYTHLTEGHWVWGRGWVK